MATDGSVTIPGVVRDGVVIPQSNTALREGTRVEILIEPSAMSPDLLAEIAAWDKASDEAWAMIDRLETEHP